MAETLPQSDLPALIAPASPASSMPDTVRGRRAVPRFRGSRPNDRLTPAPAVSHLGIEVDGTARRRSAPPAMIGA
jgi:hypothetical protein